VTLRRKVLAAASMLVGWLALFGHAQTNPEQVARKFLPGKTLLLRAPYKSDNLKFDAQGKLLNGSEMGMLPTDGLLLVEDASLKKDTIELKGKRVALALLMSEKDRLTYLPTNRKFKLSMELSVSPTSEEELMRSLNRVFLGGNVEQALENYWRPAVDISQPCSEKDKQSDGLVGLLEATRPVYRCVIPQKVTAPKAIQAKDPNFSFSALNEAEKGLIKLRVLLNERGLPEVIGVASDPGNGAVAEAITAVSRWRFSPATRNGQPVAVIIEVEIEAHPY
jgi:Gram-negative bacterial TonB protein C-terminal